jgi:hypothetical protein
MASESQYSKRQVVVDMSRGQWREKSVTGSGNRLRIFDGKDLFAVEEGGDEFVRIRQRSKGEDPGPAPYLSSNAEWAKAVEIERRPCGLPKNDHPCVLLEVPLKPWVRGGSPNNATRNVGRDRSDVAQY